MERAAFLERLSEYGNRTRETLLERLPDGEPYRHLYEPIRRYVARAGKGLRPALLIATCRAFGGRTEDALTSAAALELLHNAFLIHDDIEDVSEFRRGNQCLHASLGVPLAINAGDAMQAMALRLLRQNMDQIGSMTTWRVLGEFDHLLAQSLEGQAMELGWITDRNLEVGTADYLRMTLKKTCWYSFIHPCRIGAMLARPNAARPDSFNAFGFFLGAAFQIQDDVLNLSGRKEAYGKEILGDIYEGKRTLMVSHLATRATEEERIRLMNVYSGERHSRNDADVAWVLDSMNRYDCLAFARYASQQLITAARSEFEKAFSAAEGPDRDFVGHYLDFVVERSV